MVKLLISGELGGPGKAQCVLKASRTYDWSPWKDIINVSDGSVRYAGHSFGGTAIVSWAQPVLPNMTRLKPRRTLDSTHISSLPWTLLCSVSWPIVARLKSGLDPWTGTINCPLLSVNSEGFADSDDYERLLDVLKTVKGETQVLSIAGTTHPSFSDVFLIIPSRSEWG